METDYKKLYEDAMQLAKEWLEGKTTNQKEKVLLEAMFPQLKESEDEKIRKALIHLFQSNDTEQFGEFTNKQFLSWLEKQSEPKWSEDDEKMLSYTISLLSEFKEVYEADAHKCIDWLNSIKPQPHCEYNPYKVTIKSILEMCARYDNTLTCDKQDFLDNVRVKCKDAIEYDNLYPQSHWKPTEEQMDLLYWVKENRVFDYADREILRSLYNDLKKL